MPSTIEQNVKLIQQPEKEPYMQAMVCTAYGGPEVLQLRKIVKPVPAANQILIRIIATAVNSADYRLRKADPAAIRLFFGLLKPRMPVLGVVLAGEVEAVGKEVTRFKPGDQVFGSSGMRMGTYAEYICLPEEDTLALKPAHLSYPEAAAIPFGGTTALHFLRKARVQAGQTVLIYGASGAVGTAAVQLAKAMGAQVTGVCSTANVAMVQSLGADFVLDYTAGDFAGNGKTYDVIFDTVGKISYTRLLRSVKKKGILILAAAGLWQMIQGAWSTLTTSKKIHSGLISENAQDMIFLKEMIEAGKLQAVIDRRYPLRQLAEAHQYVEKGHKRGNVVILIDGQ